MPRTPQAIARQKLDVALANYDRAKKAERRARQALDAAMIAAVESGMPRYEVATVCGISQTRVGQIEGMPKGKNAAKTDE